MCRADEEEETGATTVLSDLVDVLQVCVCVLERTICCNSFACTSNPQSVCSHLRLHIFTLQAGSHTDLLLLILIAEKEDSGLWADALATFSHFMQQV